MAIPVCRELHGVFHAGAGVALVGPLPSRGKNGAESMGDVQFSVVTLVAAFFGGTSNTLTFVLLGLYFVASFSLIRSLNRYLGISFLASCAACAAFLLNGFALGNLNSQIGQPYFLAPLVLLSLLAFAENPAPSRFALAALAEALLFTVTVFPTMVLASLSVHLHRVGMDAGDGPRAEANNQLGYCSAVCPSTLVFVTRFSLPSDFRGEPKLP